MRYSTLHVRKGTWQIELTRVSPGDGVGAIELGRRTDP
jgi:hypothetical protein